MTESASRAQEAREFLKSAQQHVAKNEIKKTRRAATEAEKLFSVLGDDEGLGEVFLVRALAEVKLEEPDEIVKAATQASDLFKKVGRKDRQAEAIGLIVDSLCTTHGGIISRIVAALRFANRVLAMQEDAGNAAGQAKAMQRIALLHLDAKELERAEWAATEAQVLWRKAGQDEAAIRMYFLLCKVYQAIMMAEVSGQIAAVRGDNPRLALQRACALSNEAIYVTKDVKNAELRAGALYWRARTRTWQSDPASTQDAMDISDSAIKLYQELGDRAGEASTLSLQAEALAIGGKLQAAQTKAEEALKFAKAYDLDEAVEEVQELIASIKAEQAEAKSSGRAVPVEETAGDAGDALVTRTDQAKKSDLDPAFLMAKLNEIVKTVCITDDDVTQDEAFMDVGVDSLSSVTLVNEATQAFGVPLRPSVVFDYPTMRELIAHILEES
mmetsp:Transcript_35585/g.81555  ORF Transcript_35585/g.81555 Transcript_35585/m.81555 type:complete len:442 (+) Transcript_35585:120-1445(+)